LCEKPPRDLVDHFDTLKIKQYANEWVSLLTLPKAVALTKQFRTWYTQLVSPLGLIVLDDSNTSNHHCYITRGPVAGSILYLVHDDASVVVYGSLRDFLRAVQSGGDLDCLYHDELERSTLVTRPDQGALGKAIREVLRRDAAVIPGRQLLADQESVAELTAYIPALDLSDSVLLDELAHHPDMYVVEAIGDVIARSPRRGLLPIATTVSKHKIPQVKAAGKRAIAAIKKLK
jgi:hypothetical protein